MAKLVYLSTTSVDMPSIPISPGQVLYCADLPETYYDTSGLKRVILTRVRYVYAESDRNDLSVAMLKSDTLYVVTSTAKFYKWSLTTGWIQLHYTTDMFGIVELTETLVPSTLLQNGTPSAPRTLATQVFTKDGERVEDLLDDITRVGKTYRYLTVEYDGQTEYDLVLPFDNYIELGNFIEIYIGSVWISPKRYKIVSDDSGPTITTKIIFDDMEEVLVKGRDVAIVYTYNTPRVKDTVHFGIDGRYLIRNSVPIDKLENYSNDFMLDDETSVATSRAVYRAYNATNSKLNIIAGNLIAYATSYNTPTQLKTDIDNFTLVDNSTIYLRLHTDIADNATLAVNGGIAIPIYLNYKIPVKSGLKKGDVISLTYSKMWGKFFVNSSVAYKIAHYRQLYECQGGDSQIAITLEDYEPGYDSLSVSHNNLKLYEGINYTLDGHNLLLSYACKAGDIIEIEMDKVSGNGLPIDGNTIMRDITFTENVIFKSTISIEGDVLLPGGGSIDNLGNVTIGGNVTVKGNTTSNQFISTAPDGIPPLVVKSKTMVENLNADMVDNYHAVDMAMPDTTVEFIIDGESDIMDPSIQIALRSFLGRIEALKERMIMTDATDLITPTKKSYAEEFGDDYIWPINEPLYNENVRDTVEEVAYQMDEINYRVLATIRPEDENIDIDNLNEMSGAELSKDPYTVPAQTELLNTWEAMATYIDHMLFDIEERMLITAEVDTPDSQIMDAHEAIARNYAEIDISKYNIPSVDVDALADGDVDTGGDTQATALRAMYLKTQNRRFYPITHKNAIVGMPFGNVATAKSVEKLQDENADLKARVLYLEEVVNRLLSGDGGGSSTGKLVMLEGVKVPVTNS